MMFDDNVNYTLLVNNANKEFMEQFKEYSIIGSNMSFDELKEKLEMFPSKRVVFNESWFNLSDNEKKSIIELLKKQNVNFVNITSNIEDSLLSNYVIVYDEDKKVLEGNTEVVLRNEKVLKKLGYGLPFVVDLSIQLTYYDILDKVYYNMDKLTEDLWN